MYPFAEKNGVVPGSDGAGEVVAVGPKVTRFQVGSQVVTLFNQGHIGGSLDSRKSPFPPRSLSFPNYLKQLNTDLPPTETAKTGLGGTIDGTLRQYGAFPESGLVTMPPSLSYLEASTLSCAALTAWNGLYGLKPIAPGDVVLTQGTGGVSIFAVQFAKAAGATVIATTSSEKKAEVLKGLGADFVLNYREEKEWGEKAKSLTPNNEGVSRILEVGGPVTMAQSLKAIKIDGVISIIGFLGGMKDKDAPGFMDCLDHFCTVRGILVGSRVQFEEMNRAIEGNKIKPVVDEKVFGLDELREAYQYMWDQKHFGKVTIKIE